MLFTSINGFNNNFFPFKENFDNKIFNHHSNINFDNINGKINDFGSNINNIYDINEKIIGKKIVMGISSFLPKFDTIGHNILHANNELISNILSNNNLSDDVKKNIILFTIKMAQNGDNLGSKILQLYYDIVEHSL